MIVNNKVLEAHEIRAELARRKMSKRTLSNETGIGYQYLVQVVNGYYPAHRMRARITEYLFPRGRGFTEDPEFHAVLGLEVKS